MLFDDTNSSHRLSVDWYAGLAADHGASRAPTLSSMREEEEDAALATSTLQPVVNIQGTDEHDVANTLDDVDRTIGEFFLQCLDERTFTPIRIPCAYLVPI